MFNLSMIFNWKSKLTQLSTIGNGNLLVCLTTLSTIGFNLFDNVHAINNIAKYYVFSIQPRCLYSCDEKLTSISIGTSIGHRKDTRSSMLQYKVFIFEFISVYRFSSSAIMVREITTLAHKVWNNTVKNASLVTETFFSSTQSTEIFSSFWYNVTAQINAVHQ
uniref:Uncharacterized protein n=1 Tax=Sipha flava TaxID=143950 RepID=A0A2S2QQ78_9HEMI